MKILEKRYPLGTIPKQQTDGRYVNETLHQNIKLLAKNITKDMTYLGILTSSTLEVGTGKSVFAQQIAEVYLEEVRAIHGIDNHLTMKNLVFRPRDIIERSFKVPRYSVIICDEWEDLHYLSELGKSLRQFFRKCRQLNLFILIIIPNFFQLPMSYAISRSVFLIDVKFMGEFDRGYFSFYNFGKKKNLFVQGRKAQNYDCVKPNFTGRFVDGYVVDRKEYLAAKLKDLEDQENLEKTKGISEKDIKAKMFYTIYNNLKGITIDKLSSACGITSRTGDNWLSEIRKNFKENSQNAKSEFANTLLEYSTEGEKNNPNQDQEKELNPISIGQ